MSVYNGEKYLRDAIISILNQTYTDFEFLIINDASTDNSLSIIKSINDKRINLYNNQENIGLTKSLNIGLKLAKGKYIVRMDADDIALPQRLEKQFQFMEQNPEVGLCGSAVRFFGTNEIYVPPTTHDEIKMNLLFHHTFFHPTVIFNTSLFAKYNLHYNPKFEVAQDYELWTRAVNCFMLANIEEALIEYRFHNEQIGNKKKNCRIKPFFRSEKMY